MYKLLHRYMIHHTRPIAIKNHLPTPRGNSSELMHTMHTPIDQLELTDHNERENGGTSVVSRDLEHGDLATSGGGVPNV